MALPHKPGPAQALALIGQVPSPPKLPEEVRDRFPSLVQWQGDFTNWWSTFQDLFQRDRQAVTTQFTADETSTAASLSTIQSSITTLSDRIASLALQIQQGSNIQALSAQVLNLSAQVQGVITALNAHAGSTTAHGTGSAVVGQSDIETLDNKTIGSFTPGYGRFEPPVIMVNEVPPGTSVTVALGEAMLTVGTLTVYGALKVDGNCLVI